MYMGEDFTVQKYHFLCELLSYTTAYRALLCNASELQPVCFSTFYFFISEKDWIWRRRVSMAASAAESRASRMKSKSYSDVVIGTFNELRQNDELCDFTVCAGGKSIRVILLPHDTQLYMCL